MERKSGGYCPSVRATRDGPILYAAPNDRSVEFRPSPLRMAQVGRLSGWVHRNCAPDIPANPARSSVVQERTSLFVPWELDKSSSQHWPTGVGSGLPIQSRAPPRSRPHQWGTHRHLGSAFAPQTRLGTPDEAHGTTDAEASSVTSRADMV